VARTPFHVLGTGWALPDGVVTNVDLEARMDTSDEWIRERTGIRERRVGGTTGELATAAARAALGRAPGAPPVSMLLVATSTPDEAIPATAAVVAGELGLECGTADLNGACAGFVYALVAAGGFLDAGGSVLVVGADVMTRITDPVDRGTAILFSDGAGALLLAPAPAGSDAGLLGWDAGTDASTHDILRCDLGGTIEMAGQAVFKVAIRSATASVHAALDAAGVEPADVALFVPHQANQRITDALAGRLGLGPERVVSTIATTGNSSAATIPHALAVADRDGRLRDGDVVVVSGFGAGMTWATAVLRWSSGADDSAAPSAGRNPAGAAEV
jgi:3-oxoacyl-[acyl-carrier-protein] synthase-3